MTEFLGLLLGFAIVFGLLFSVFGLGLLMALAEAFFADPKDLR